MKVVLLIGPSSAGKSTLCDLLVDQHGWHTHGIDEAMSKRVSVQTPKFREMLSEKNLLTKLKEYNMTEEQIISIGMRGLLELNYKDRSIKHQFTSPDYTDLNRVLTNAGFRGIELEELNQLLLEVGVINKNLPDVDPVNIILDDIFKLDSDASVILDMVPSENINEMLDEIKDRIFKEAEKYNRSIEYNVVMVYCPPQALSDRIISRNKAAESSGNLENKREGVFPLLQLSQLIRAYDSSETTENTMVVSKLALLKLMVQHVGPEVDKEIPNQSKGFLQAAVHAYGKFARNVGISNTGSDTLSFQSREDLSVDGSIDLSEGSPKHLTETFLKIINEPVIATRP